MQRRSWIRTVSKFTILGTMLLSSMAHAAFFITGTVETMVVWRIGNVSFTLSTATTSCNGEFILNSTEPGFKNLYAALLAAKRTGTAVKVFSSTCVVAANYGNSDSYNIVDYLYPQD